MRAVSRSGRGARSWLWQRLSAAALLILIMAHLWIEHFVHPRRPITYRTVAARLLHGGYQAVDYALLLVVVYHALNGFKNILSERRWSRAGWMMVSAGIGMLGVVTVVLGADILSAFLNTRPWFYL